MVTFPDVTLNDMMRKVLSSTAGATFHEETPTFTINIKKEMIELIYKLAPSWYVIVNVFHASEKELMLCCEWGHYYDRLKNPAVQMPKIESYEGGFRANNYHGIVPSSRSHWFAKCIHKSNLTLIQDL